MAKRKSPSKAAKKSKESTAPRPSRAFGLWRQAWKTKNTPWVAPNSDKPLLQFLRSEKGLRRGASILVPLCGNSSIIKKLHQRGFNVTGVEYVPEALSNLKKQFGRRTWKTAKVPAGREYSRERIALLQQDFLQFRKNAAFDLIYDRAAFVAMNPRHRRRYAAVLRRSLRSGGLLYIVVFRMRGAERPGPPFSVQPADMRKHFGALKLLHRSQHTDRLPPARYKEVGVKEIVYSCYIYKR